MRTTITSEELQQLPLKSFKGEIILIEDEEALAQSVEQIRRHHLLGFDTETRPSFRKGEFHKVALVQLAIPGKTFLIRIQKTGLSKGLIDVLANPKIIKAGVAIRDDIKALQKLRDFQPESFVDLAIVAREKGIGVESVKKLTGLLLGFKISKVAQTSNWEVAALTNKQIEYAATDAWVCLEIYKKLHKQ